MKLLIKIKNFFFRKKYSVNTFFDNRDCVGLLGFGDGFCDNAKTCYSCDKRSNCVIKSKEYVVSVLPEVSRKTDEIFDIDIQLNGMITNESLKKLVEFSLVIDGKDCYDFFRESNKKAGYNCRTKNKKLLWCEN